MAASTQGWTGSASWANPGPSTKSGLMTKTKDPGTPIGGKPGGAAASTDPASAGGYVNYKPWWEIPGLSFDPATGAPIRKPYWGPGFTPDLTVPDWMGLQGASSFYDLYQGATPEQRPAMILSEQDAWRIEQKKLAGQAAGRQWLGEQMSSVEAGAESWANDPFRQMVMDAMSERAAPGYQFFSPMERTAAVLPIAQQTARGQAQLAGNAAARGMGAGSAAMDRSALLAGQANIGETMVRGGFDQAQRTLSQQAIANLAQTAGGYEGLDLQYQNARSQLAGALAALEMGLDFEPTDYTVWPALAEGSRQAEKQAAQAERMIAAMEEESKFDIQDLVNQLLSASGGGAKNYAIAGLGGLASLFDQRNQAA